MLAARNKNDVIATSDNKRFEHNSSKIELSSIDTPWSIVIKRLFNRLRYLQISWTGIRFEFDKNKD